MCSVGQFLVWLLSFSLVHNVSMSDNYRSDNYRSDNYRSDGYLSDGYLSDGYRSDGYRRKPPMHHRI